MPKNNLNNKLMNYTLFLIIILSLMIRVIYIEDNRDFWHDESFQFLYSNDKSVRFILEPNDVHPPLFNLFAKLITNITTNVVLLRFFMVSLFACFLVAIYFLVSENINKGVAIISIVLFSLLPTWIHYSTEFRSYMFVLWLVAIQIRSFNNVLKKANFFWYSVYLLTSICMVWSHYFSGLIILTQTIYLIIFERKRLLQDFFKIYLVLIAFCVPLLLYAINTTTKVYSFWFKDIDLISFISTFNFYVSPPTKYSLLLFILSFMVIIPSLTMFKLKPFIIQLIMYATIPVMVAWVFSQFVPIYHHRFFLFGGLSYIILLAWCFFKWSKRYPLYSSFCLGFFILLSVSFGFFSLREEQNFQIQNSVEFILKDNETFSVIHTSPFSQTPYKYYLYGKGIDNYLLTNLSNQQLFTAGGSVINKNEIINQCFIDNYQGKLYFVSHKPIGKVVWYDGGLYVSTNQR